MLTFIEFYALINYCMFPTHSLTHSFEKKNVLALSVKNILVFRLWKKNLAPINPYSLPLPLSKNQLIFVDHLKQVKKVTLEDPARPQGGLRTRLRQLELYHKYIKLNKYKPISA